MRVFLFFGIVLITILSCQKEASNEDWAGINLPAHFSSIQQDIDVNSITYDQFKLGRKLFFDPILSIDSSISCQSCHQPESAFSHLDHDLSHGVFDRLGTRNAIALQNLLWHQEYFWDGGVHHIHLISPNPIENPVEMDETTQGIVQKLNRHSVYRQMFRASYGIDTIDINHVLKAFTAYQAALISCNSKFDEYLKGNKNVFTTEETEGYQLFLSKCGSCHSGPLLSDFKYRSNGLDETLTKDLGRYNISLKNTDKGTFKTPSLRNITVSMPYMHDGRFRTLDQVLDHYQKGIKPHPNLDPILKNGIPMTELEKQLIITFLKTLQDNSFLNDKRLRQH